jgi:hypothetical protein
MSEIALDETTAGLLEGFALPDESMAAAVRRALTLAYHDLRPPTPAWLANAIAVWLEFEGLHSEGAENRLASHILNNWEMVRVTGPGPSGRLPS